MKIDHKKLDLEAVRHRTYMQKSRLESYKKHIDDPDKKKRIEEQECVICFYGSKIGGQAITETNCSICETAMHFGSTNTDMLCKACAKDHTLCKHCGADINYKQRNKL